MDILRTQVRNSTSREESINRVREFLQIAVLKILFDRSAFDYLAFQGGTALRILYDLRRFSEDLDFSLTALEKYDLPGLEAHVRGDLVTYGIGGEITMKKERVVHQLSLKFPDILQELGISSQKGQKLFIKIEIDTNPPAGWHTMLSLVNKIFLFTVRHFDPASLYATKLHACFFRKYTKGRDFYDLLWYAGKKMKPNFTLLNNAIRQTERMDMGIDEGNFPRFLADRLSLVDFSEVQRDLAPFIEDRKELKLFEKETFLQSMDS